MRLSTPGVELGAPKISIICFPVFAPYNISKIAIFGAPSSTPEGDKYASTDFFVQNSMFNNFYFKHFWI